jgi:hypothetical protein
LAAILETFPIAGAYRRDVQEREAHARGPARIAGALSLATDPKLLVG